MAWLIGYISGTINILLKVALKLINTKPKLKLTLTLRW